MCHTCEGSETPGRETSGARNARGKSKKRDSPGGKGKSPIGTSSGEKRGQPVAKKPGGVAKRKQVSVEEKVDALGLLARMSLSVVAAKMGTGESTVYGWKKKENKIQDAGGGAKSTKQGGRFHEGALRVCTHIFPLRARTRECACVCFLDLVQSRRKRCTLSMHPVVPTTDGEEQGVPHDTLGRRAYFQLL